MEFPYLEVQNSWGTGMGDNGFYYFPRSVINLEIKTIWTFTFKDIWMLKLQRRT